jgi:hypothetical protein
MLLQILAAVLLLLGSGLIFHALLSLDRPPHPAIPWMRRVTAPSPGDRDLPRAA